MLVNILQCTGQHPPTARNYLAQNVNGAGVEKPWVNPHAGNGFLIFTMKKKMTGQNKDKKIPTQKKKKKKKNFWEMSKLEGGSAAGGAGVGWSHDWALLVVGPRAGHKVMSEAGWGG